MKTYQLKGKSIKRDWHVIDAKGKILGRLATEVATFLMGKHKAGYAPHLDSGDFVVILNAEKVAVTGNKEKNKLYRRHSGYPGGFKEVSLRELRRSHPERIVEHAVKGMLPSNRLLAPRMKRLKTVVGEVNPYAKKIKA